MTNLLRTQDAAIFDADDDRMPTDVGPFGVPANLPIDDNVDDEPWCIDDGERIVVMSATEVRSGLVTGTLTHEMRAWADGLACWEKLKTLPEFRRIKSHAAPRRVAAPSRFQASLVAAGQAPSIAATTWLPAAVAVAVFLACVASAVLPRRAAPSPPASPDVVIAHR